MTESHPQGFLAAPPGGKGRGVLVLHPWWGLNQSVKDFASRLAGAGFVAFAPDLYDGKVVKTIPDAERAVEPIFADLARPRAKLADAMAFLSQRPGLQEGGLGALGFSLGAFFAVDLSVSAPDRIRSVVLYYGTGPGDYGVSRASYLGHFAETDPFEEKEGVDGMEAALRKAGRPVTFHHYPGTGHWFAEPDRTDAYNPAAAQLAWDRTLEFLKNIAAV